jgi:hypothetical protein
MPSTFTNGTLRIDFTGLTAAQVTDIVESNLHAEGIHQADPEGDGVSTPIENLTVAQKLALFHTRVVRRYLMENRRSWKERQAAIPAGNTANTDITLD